MSRSEPNSTQLPKWATEPVIIARPDPGWPKKAQQLQTELSALGLRDIQHIGSTSVPDLPAKPIIDLVASIPTFDTIDPLIAALRKLDWHYVPPELDQRPFRRLLIKVENEKRAAHLHLMLPGSKEREAEIRFRDLLRRSEPLRTQYASLKQRLATEHAGDREAYTNAKTNFIITAMANKPRLIFATNNQHKVTEIQSAIGDKLEIITLRAAGIDIDIPEPHETLEENATEKSTTIHKMTNENVFSEDTGLEIEALNGEPGVHTAYYGGPERSAEKNNAKVLQKLGDNPNRKARFRTIISLIYNDREYLFEGITEGRILEKPTGTEGFGYDPIFAPNGDLRSFGQMTLEEKNKYSHRSRAAEKLITFLLSQM